MKPLIAHILPYTGFGGTELATLRLARAARAAGFDSIVVHPHNSKVEAVFSAEAFPTIPYDTVEPSYTHPAAYWHASRSLARQLCDHGVALVHFADLLGAHYCSLAGLLARVPMVCHIRCRHAAISLRDRSFLLPVREFIFVSENTWADFGHRVPRNRGVVLYDGVSSHRPARPDPELRWHLGIAADHKVVGMAARIGPPKDYATLIQAAAAVVRQYPAVTFLLVGDYSNSPVARESFARIQELLAANSVTANFVFTGFRDDIEAMIALMDIAVLSSKSEGLPLFLLEAMAQAKPVIATRVGGVAETVEHGITGLLHSPGDASQLATDLLSLLTDDRQAETLGSAGYRRVEARFSQTQFERSVADLYARLLSAAHPLARTAHTIS